MALSALDLDGARSIFIRPNFRSKATQRDRGFLLSGSPKINSIPYASKTIIRCFPATISTAFCSSNARTDDVCENSPRSSRSAVGSPSFSCATCLPMSLLPRIGVLEIESLGRRVVIDWANSAPQPWGSGKCRCEVGLCSLRCLLELCSPG